MKFHHANWITMPKPSRYTAKRCFMISLVYQYIIVCYPGSLLHISITRIPDWQCVTVTQSHAYHPLRWVRRCNNIRRHVNASKQDWYVSRRTVIKRFDVRARNEIATTANSASSVETLKVTHIRVNRNFASPLVYIMALPLLCSFFMQKNIERKDSEKTEYFSKQSRMNFCRESSLSVYRVKLHDGRNRDGY